MRIRRTLRRVTAATAALAVVALLGGCGDDGDDGTASPTPTPTSTSSSQTPTPSESETPSPTATPVESAVHFLVDTRNGIRLVRELQDLPGEDPGKEAVEAMIAGPEDPDYTTAWNPETEVLSVTQEADAITVDLSEDARTANIGSEGAAMMIQQLVYTVSEAVDRKAPVELLIEGEPAGELWGAVSWDGPVARAAKLDVLSLVQVDRPREGDVTSSPVTVSGEAAVFEATLPWRMLDAAGDVVKSGTAMTAEGQRFAPYSFEIELDPGTYTIEVTEDDPSGGEGGEPITNTRTVTVE